MKRFSCIGGLWRGRLGDGSFIRNILTIIHCVLILQCSKTPLRSLTPLIDDEEVRREQERVESVWENREYCRGLPLGDPDRDILATVDGSVPVHSRAVAPDTGCSFSDFKTQDRVLVWWGGFWWRGTITRASARLESFRVRFDWSGVATSGIPAHEMHKM
jgi:hypothetical protein